MDNKEILERVDSTIRENNQWQLLYILLTVLLFVLGIGAIGLALYKGQLIWTIPSAFTTFFLKWPLIQIKQMRDKNIALAIVPALITKLPEEAAAKQIQKLIEKLYEK